MDILGRPPTYLMLAVPVLLGIILFARGVTKLARNEPDGNASFWFGVLSLVLVAAAYFLFIR